MNYLILSLAILAVAVGSAIAIVIVSIIFCFRRQKTVTSLNNLEQLVGSLATVEVPFNRDSKGKVRVQVMETILYFTAFTSEKKQFNAGEQVVIIQIKNNQVWVVDRDFA